MTRNIFDDPRLPELLSEPDKERVNYLVQVARRQLIQSVVYQYLDELTNAEKIEAASPLDLINAATKLLRLLKDEKTPELMKFKQKLSGLVSLDDIKNEE